MYYRVGVCGELTVDAGALSEDLGDFRVHLYVQVLLLGDLEITIEDLLLDPIIELPAYDGAGHIDDELLRQPPQLILLRKVQVALRVLADEAGDISYA